MSPFDSAQRNYLPVGCNAETKSVNAVLVESIRYARRPLKVSILRVAVDYLSVSALLQVVTVPARHRSYVFLSLEDVETLRNIGWYCAALDSSEVSFPSHRTAL